MELSIILKVPREGAEEILLKLKNKEFESDETIKYGTKKIPLKMQRLFNKIYI